MSEKMTYEKSVEIFSKGEPDFLYEIDLWNNWLQAKAFMEGYESRQDEVNVWKNFCKEKEELMALLSKVNKDLADEKIILIHRLKEKP